MSMVRRFFLPLPLGSLLFLLSLLSAPAEILIHSGDSIAFLGDSITKQGAGSSGWCGLVISSLQSAGIDATQINAGKGGHTSRDMAGRFEADIIAKKPTWMILMCGTNDNPGHGLPLEESGKNIRTIVEKTQAAGIKVLLATRPMRGGDTKENAYNAFIRDFAREKEIPLADVFAAMKLAQESYLKQNPALPATFTYLTIADGTHMNPRGNQVIAERVLLALGLSPEQIAKAKESWPNPDAVKSIGAEEAQKDTIPER
jgi:lysophospholipase L1-like esterase